MNQKEIRKTAILVDGGYYRKRASALWGRKSAEERANELFRYCLLHISESDEPRDLYRIFYYDCPGLTRQITHPLTGNVIDFSAGAGTRWTKEFFEKLATKRKVAIRRGELAENQAEYILKANALDDLLHGVRAVQDLTEKDFRLDVKQKGVDMRIGLDATSIAMGKHADQIVLIAGDSDFLPVAKIARRNGIDFILDPMKQMPKANLQEHVDGIETFTDKMYAEDTEA